MFMHHWRWRRMTVLGSLALSGLVGAAGLPQAVGVTEVEAAFPGGNGLITYISNADSGSYESDIYTISLKGNKTRRLTANAGSNYDPAWSADGTRIAFSSDRDGDSQIYAMNADGSGVTQLTHDPASGGEWPAWSPDGSKIAYVQWPEITIHEIWVMNADGSGQTQLTTNGVNSLFPAWSPDGTKIAYSVNNGNPGDVWVMNADGSNPVNLTPGSATGTDPEWSPDGKKLSFVTGRNGNAEVYVMNADGSGQTNLTNNSADEADHAWSPDGKQIVFTSTRSGYSRLYVMNADGTKQKELKTGKFLGGYVDHPDWQPLSSTHPRAGSAKQKQRGHDDRGRDRQHDRRHHR